MQGPLKDIVTRIRNYPGILRKQPIQQVVDLLSQTLHFGNQLPSYGDDAAVIPWGDEYLLVAADGMMTGLLVNEPYAAGKASVMVTVNDIYSMGGRPIGMVNVLASGDDTQRRRIVEGIEKGCRKLQVPMLGGHLHPDSPVDCPALSVTIIGHAKKLLRSHLAAAGDRLILAVDLDGRAGCRSVVSWDANSGKSPEALRHRLEALPLVAESEAAFAAKDVSNAGILGTAAIMLENSGKGADIDLDAIPRPDSLTLEQWLLCFQSFGFILSVPPENIDRVFSIFSERGITVAAIGGVREGNVVDIHKNGISATLFDFSQDVITGISCSREKPYSKSFRS
jgi:selenophosphate synthetase-related protein